MGRSTETSCGAAASACSTGPPRTLASGCVRYSNEITTPKLAPPPTERSEEIGIGALARDDDLAGRERNLGGQQIVYGHPELSHQPGDTPAERETPTSDRRTALASLSGRLLREMEGGEHSSTELTISVKVPCQECGGRGYVETVNEDAHVVGDTTQECLTCGGRGAIPDDMPLSQFRELLASDFGHPFR
jgi:hypothetical protein